MAPVFVKRYGNEGADEDQGVELYGFRLTQLSKTVTIDYTLGAIGKTPANVDLSTGSFEYGSWRDAWFVKGNKPVMLNSDGTEAYELDPDDHTKKMDSTASDVSDVSFNGNAMSRIPRVYLKMWEEGDVKYCNVCNMRLDDDYHAYAHTRADGSEMDYIYLSMFDGSLVDGKMRSIKGLDVIARQVPDDDLVCAKNNGSLWSIRSWSHRNLIDMLLILMSKSLDTQTSFGYGYCMGTSSVTTSPPIKTGTLYDKGQFYGSDDGLSAVKVFYIENWWGHRSEIIEGLITEATNSHKILVRPYPPYDFEGTDHIDTGISLYKSGDGWINDCQMSEYGMIPKSQFNDKTIQDKYHDRFSYSSGRSAIVGGHQYGKLECGALNLSFSADHSSSTWAYGYGLSCEQCP